jgi:hypothetical protein
MEKVNSKCLIVGNGPSVNSIDFNSLREATDISTMCCNRIDLLIKEKNWLPDYYFCFKSNVDKKWKDSIKNVVRHEDIKCFLAKEFKSFLPEASNLTFVENVKEHYRHSPVPFNLFENSWDVQPFKSYGATVPIFQYCFSRNVKTIGVIGQDGYIFDVGQNHFCEEYGYETTNFKQTNERIRILYNVIKKHCEKTNIDIYNLSNKSVIDSCPVLSFNDFLKI